MTRSSSSCESDKRDLEKQSQTNAASPAHQMSFNVWPNAGDDEMEREISESEPQHEREEAPEKPGGNLTSIISRTISRRSVASSYIEPAPDGGLKAWTQCICTHLTILTTFGYITSFGVFQTYYQTTLGVSPSAISWIGSVQIFLLFGIGTISGRATDAGFFRHVYIAGAVFQIVGIFCTAQAKTFWQLFLAQAICTGIANGLQYCPAMALVTTYFAKRRAFAVGVTALGSCTGGVIFPIIVQQCLGPLGFPWTIRIIGFIMLAMNIITIALYRTRIPPRRSGQLVDLASFRELPYALYCAAMFMTFWGLYFAFFYIGSYGRTVLGVSYQQSINLLLVVVCMGFVFRLLPNYFADKVGTLNMLIPFVFLCGIMMFGWIGIHSVGGLFAFAAIYGSGSAVIQALWPAMFGNLSRVPDLKKAGVRMGMAFTVVSFASLTGPPLAGAIITRHGWKYAQLWAGLSFFVGGALLVLTRWSKVGWDWRARI